MNTLELLPIAARLDRWLDAHTRVRTWSGTACTLPAGLSWTGLVLERGTVRLGEDVYPVRAGMVFVAPDGAELSGGAGLAIGVVGFRGWPLVAGPIERLGRLRYIDGCTDTVLVSPPRRGDPCLNHLHLPAGTRQTAHWHPSLRAGVVARGSGRCVTGEGTTALTTGLGWWIPPGVVHAFHTDADALDVLAWHPETDTGPTDHDHPMVNRTMLGRPPEPETP